MNYSTKDATSVATNLTGNYPFLRLNEAYVLITRRNFCAAKILDRLQSWDDWKIKKRGDRWVRLTLEKIWRELQGEHCIETIRSAMNRLINQFQFVERRHNPNAPYDRAYQYRFNREEVAKAIAALSQEEAETPAVSHFQNDEPSSPNSPAIISQDLGDVYEEDPITDPEIDLITTPTHHPVVVKNKSKKKEIATEEAEVSKHPNLNSSLSQSSTNQPKPTPKDQYSATAPAEVLTKVEAAGYQLNPNLKKVVLNATLQVVTDALEAVREYLTTGKPVRKTREALLVSAIEHQWKPNSSEDPHAPKSAPVGFREWFDLAKKIGLVQASMLRDGVLCVYTSCGEWKIWEEFAVIFSLKKLRQMIAATKASCFP